MQACKRQLIGQMSSKKTRSLTFQLLCPPTLTRQLARQAKMQSVSKSMVGIVSGLDRALASNNLEKMAMTMDQFERQLENLDLQSEFVEGAMSNQATLSTPEDEVNSLLQQVRPLSHFDDLRTLSPG